MSNEISSQNIAGLQDEMLRNISSIKQKISEWLERPQVGGIESLSETMAEVRNILALLNRPEAAELCDAIIAVIVVLQNSVHEAGDSKPANFDNAGAEVASAILILDDYIEHLGDKRDVREHILAMLQVMRSLKEDATSTASYAAQPRISKDTYQALASKVSEVIEGSRNQIEQHRRDANNPLNADAIIGHNKELISLFAALNLREPQFLLQKINQILSGTPTEAQWIDVAEAMILVEETLQKGSNDQSSDATVSDYAGARAQQTRHSRQLEVEHLLKDTGETAAQFFETLSKKVVHEETIQKTQGWRPAAVRLAHYSAIADLVGLSSLSGTLRGMGKVYTAMSLQDTFPESAYKPVVESLVGAEYIFTDLAQNSRPSEQDIAFLKEAVVQIANLIPISAEAEKQFAGFIDASETEAVEERDDLSDTFGKILSNDLATLDRFGTPMALEDIETEHTEEDAASLSPTMVHVSSIKDIQTNASPPELENVTIHSNVRSASDQEHAIPVAPAIQAPATDTPADHTAEAPVSPPASTSVSSATPDLANAILPESSPATGANIQFVPFFRDKTFADLDHLQVPASKQGFVAAHADAVMDDEIREFFGEEFAEILERLNDAFPKWQQEPDSPTLTTDIRRAFHTLKGSGRTVGYESLGEFAWQHEQLLNRILDNHYRANPLVQSTVGDAIDLLNILNQQQEFSEHQGALLRQAAAAESVREALMQDGELGENAQTFAQASLQWRLHDGNLGDTPSPLASAAPTTPTHAEALPSIESPGDANEDALVSDAAQDFQAAPESSASPEAALDFDLYTPDSDDDSATHAHTEEEPEQWTSPFDLLPQDQVGLAVDTDAPAEPEPSSASSDDLGLAVDFEWDSATDDTTATTDAPQHTQEETAAFTLMDDDDWQPAPEETSDQKTDFNIALDHASDPLEALTPVSDPQADFDVALDHALSDTQAPLDALPASRLPDDMAKSDILADDLERPLDSITVDALPPSDAQIVSKVVRTLEKGLVHDEGDGRINHALQVTLERQLQDEFLANPERLAALAQAVQQQMAHNDAATLHQVQSIFSQMQAHAAPLPRPQTDDVAPIDPRAEQIVRMLEKSLANSADNPALTEALEATLQRQLSNDVLGDSNKLDALMEEISATLAAFPTITPDTAQSDDFLASVEQISQSIELGLSLGELSPDDKDALAAAIKQELLFPPASEQDSEQLKEAVEIRLQEKQLLPASDIRDVVQKAFSADQTIASQAPVTPEISHETPAASSSPDEALATDFSWSDTPDDTATSVSHDEADFAWTPSPSPTPSPAPATSDFNSDDFAWTPSPSLSPASSPAPAASDFNSDDFAWTPSPSPVPSSAPAASDFSSDDFAWAPSPSPSPAPSPAPAASDFNSDDFAWTPSPSPASSSAPAASDFSSDDFAWAPSPSPSSAPSPAPSPSAFSDTDFGWSEHDAAPSIHPAALSTMQKTLDKALSGGAVDDSAVAAIGMALAHQWQQNRLPTDEATFAQMADQLRDHSEHSRQDMDHVLQALASRLGIAPTAASSSPSLSAQTFENAFVFADSVEASAIATLQKTLDKALRAGEVDDSVANGIGMALAHQWQQHHLPRDEAAFAEIAAQLRNSSAAYSDQDVNPILDALALRLGVPHRAASAHSTPDVDQWFDFTQADAEPTPANITPDAVNTLQKTLDKALQSGTVDESIATSIGMALARQWQQANLPADDAAFAQLADQLRAHSPQHQQHDVDQILQALANRLGVSAPSFHNDAQALLDSAIEASTTSPSHDWESAFAHSDTQDDTEALSLATADTDPIDPPEVFALTEDAHTAPAVSSDWEISDAGDEAEALPLMAEHDAEEALDVEPEAESAWDIEAHTPQLAETPPTSSNTATTDGIRLSFDLSGNAPVQTAGAGKEDWSNTVEYVRPSISIKSSAASQRLSQELEQLAQHPTLDDALVRHSAASLEDGADTAVFLHAVDKFENLSQRIEEKSDPETINELIESVYDIEDSIESETAPDWIWQMLDAVEQLLLMYKYQGANVSTSAASILRQSAHLIEHHRDQDNEEEALETINSLIAARQERSKLAEAQPEQSAPSYAAAQDSYNDELLLDPNANSMLSETFLDEAMTLFGRSQLDAERWDEDLSRLGILDRIRRDMHTLKGSARMAGYMAIGDLTHSVENLIDSILDGYSEASSRAAAILSGAMWQGMLMLDNIRDGYLPQTDPYILNNISEYLNQPLPYPEIAQQEKRAKEQQRLEAEEAQFRPIDTPTPAPAAATQTVEPPAPEETVFGEGFDSDIDPILVDVFTDEAEELLANTEHYLEEDITNTAIIEEFKRTMHTLKGSSRLVGLSVMGDTAHLMESVMEKMPDLRDDQTEQARTLLQGGYESLRNMLDAVLRQEMPKPAHAVNQSLEKFVREGEFIWPPVQEAPVEPVAEPAPVASQAAESVAEAAPAVAPATDMPDEAAQALAPAHAVAPAPIAEEKPAATTPSPAPSAAPEIVPPATDVPAAPEVQPPAPQAEEAPASDAKKDDDAERMADKAPDVSRFVRVDAQVLDEIITFAGEASIMRSRMESIAGGVAFSLGELTRISTRIAEQMRRLDNETEAQMLFRREQHSNDDEHFDPLEMDRFTEIQQLSRQLSEAIDDLKNVQETLASDNAELQSLTNKQADIQRNLQDRLLTTQLMRFDVNEPRLKRLVRQTARSVGKDVQFVLEGGQVELERRLLEDVLPALEHMIRNSIAHGIELPAQRRAAGKPEVGTIKLVVAVQSSEVVMRLIDDGQGFDYDRIRNKAREKGYLDESLADDKQYLNSLILRSGFSTAQSLTQLSGRGVGMDVVNEMVKQRRGRLGADSLPGKGTEFTIVMPFSMSIAEVLLVDIGGRTYAAPMSSIAAVRQVSRDELQSSADGNVVHLHYDERDYRLYVLGQYFEPGRYEFATEYLQLPVLFVDSGDEAAAFHVDRILNRLEIIVKNVNRQVLNIPGISGATVFGDNEVVPVLELMDLARRIGNIVPTQEVEEQPESTEKRILVVDDSVTMRKVSTRLLERNHFIVETAKDGLDAIEVLQHFKPDLIMLDIEMPRMDGFEFASHVRQNSDVPNVPIVMVTSRTGDKHRERAGQIGVQGYLGKPYREDILMETLNSLLGSGELS